MAATTKARGNHDPPEVDHIPAGWDLSFTSAVIFKPRIRPRSEPTISGEQPVDTNDDVGTPIVEEPEPGRVLGDQLAGGGLGGAVVHPDHGPPAGALACDHPAGCASGWSCPSARWS